MDDGSLPTRIERIEEVLAYENRYIRIFDDHVLFPNKARGRYLRMHWKSEKCAAVVPITHDGQLLLIRQYSYASSRWMLQIPKGFVETGEQPRQAAARELREELGATYTHLELLAILHVDPGVIETPLEVYLAQGVSLTDSTEHEESELIDGVVAMPLHFCTGLQLLQRTSDPVTIAAVQMAREKVEASR